MKNPTLPANSLCFGTYEFDLRSGELRKHGIRLKLQEQPSQILAILLEHRGEMVTRDELQRRLWPSDTFVDFDHSLNTAVMRLREALSDSSENPRFIETLPRRGYRFVAPVEEKSPAAPETTIAQSAEVVAPQTPQSNDSPAITSLLPEPATTLSKTSGRIPLPRFVAVSLLASALIVVGARPRRPFGRPSLGFPPPQQLTSLLVLPFQHLSSHKD